MLRPASTTIFWLVVVVTVILSTVEGVSPFKRRHFQDLQQHSQREFSTSSSHDHTDLLEVSAEEQTGNIILGAGSKPITVTQAQIDSFRTELLAKAKKVPKDKLFYTWTDFSHCIRWHLQGGVRQGEMDYFVHIDRESTLSMAGAGIYMAASPTSSREFGFCLVTWELPEGTPYYDASLANRIIGKGTALNNRQKVDLGKLVPFIHNYNSDWNVVHHLSLVQKCKFNLELTMPRLHGAVVYQFFEELRRIPDELKNNVDQGTVDLWKHAAGYTYSLYQLMYYYDPVSLLRAIHVMPDDPWRAFEPERFGPFMEARSSLIRQVLLEKKPLGIVANTARSYAGSEWPKPTLGSGTTWVNKMRDEILPMIYKKFSGTDIKYRDKGIRAGGDEEGQTFAATGQQADVMANNKYIETTCKPNTAPGAFGYLCFYRYPAADAYGKCASRLTPAVRTRAQANPTGPEAEKLTRDMMTDLLTSVFTGNAGANVGQGAYKTDQPANDPPAHAYLAKVGSSKCIVDLMVDLVAVHPCLDFNGRSTRGFAHMAAIEGGLPAPVMTLYDFDLTTSMPELQRFVSLSTVEYEHIQREMIRIMWEKTIKGERVHLNNGYKTIGNGWMNIMKPLQVMGVNPPTSWSSDLDRIIEKREWMKMLDKFGGAGWEVAKKSVSGNFK